MWLLITTPTHLQGKVIRQGSFNPQIAGNVLPAEIFEMKNRLYTLSLAKPR